jgi:hypothetical protein
MALELKPSRGGFLRPFGCGWFIREYLLGNGPEDSKSIDPKRGAPQADINFEYKEALARATAREGRKELLATWWSKVLMLLRKKRKRFTSVS